MQAVETHTLVIDAGGTKCDWALLGADAGSAPRLRFATKGLSATMSTDERLQEVVAEAFGRLASARVDRIRYYGTGCGTPANCRRIESALARVWPDADIEVESDLLGAARAVLGSKPGIACILGTGSNSCLYDGRRITDNLTSLGFMLREHGSGAALGRRLLADVFQRRLPEQTRRAFVDCYDLTLEELLDAVYRRPQPGTFMASFVPFLNNRHSMPGLEELLEEEFEKFFRHDLDSYRTEERRVAFAGSIASCFRDVLERVALRCGYRLGEVSDKPMEGLLAYHREN